MILMRALPAIVDLFSDLNIAFHPRTKISAIIAPFSSTIVLFFAFLHSFQDTDENIWSQYNYIGIDEANEQILDETAPKNMICVRFLVYLRLITDQTGLEAVNEDGSTSVHANRQNGLLHSFNLFFENIPMLYVKFIELFETQNTVSIFWAVSVLSNFVSVMKGVIHIEVDGRVNLVNSRYYLKRVKGEDCSEDLGSGPGYGFSIAGILFFLLPFLTVVLWEFEWTDYTHEFQRKYGI